MASVVESVHQSAPEGGPSEGGSSRLRRELPFWGALALSLAAMGASLAININPQGSEATVGRAVPLTFVLATIAVLLVAYGFVRATSYFNTAGSVYGLTGAMVGPRAGVIGGWSMMAAYTGSTLVTAVTAGIFAGNLLMNFGVWKTTPLIAPWILALLTLALVTFLALYPIKRVMTLLLGVEIVTTLLILVVGATVLIRVASGSAPNGAHFTLNMFTIPSGVGFSTLFLGVVFGFLSFAGFEASATLGEETKDPRRGIPMAILGVAIFGGVFFTIMTAIELMGFGTDANGLANFAASTSLIGDLGKLYIASPIGNLVTFGTMVAAIGCCLASAVPASRLLFAMGRDAAGGRSVAKVSARSGEPVVATIAITGVAALLIILVRATLTQNIFDLFVWGGTIGVYFYLVAYALLTAGVWYFLNIRAQRRGVQPRPADRIVPILALLVVGYTLFRNAVPWPSTFALQLCVILAVIWVLIPVVGMFLAPGLARRMGQRLASEEGLELPGTAVNGVVTPRSPGS
jgi:amino acid transporter